MDLHKIKILLDKYYQGETSLEEERILKEYFSQQNSQKNNLADNHIMNYFDSQKVVIPTNLNEELNDIVENEWKHDTKLRFIKIVKWAASIAAVIVFAIGIMIFSKDKPSMYADTFQTHDEAYMETKRVLLFISNTMNNKTGSLKYLSNAGNSLIHITKLSEIDKTLNSIKNEDN